MANINKIWVLTAEVNEYDQFGAYFVSWFPEKPVFKIIRKIILKNYSDEYVRHILNGGGRIYTEHTWYSLSEVDPALNLFGANNNA